MDESMSLSLLAIATLLSCSGAIAAGVFWGRDSVYISLKKKIGSLETDMVSVSLELERLRGLLKSLSNRTALADYKAEKRGEPKEFRRDMPASATKDELRARYLRGTHIEIARRAMQGAKDE
jgi:regulator of replication initiation timing